MEKTWVLIANAERARCFERHGADHSLTELIGFVHPHVSLSDKAGEGDLTGAAGKGHGRTAHAGTQFEPHTEAHAKERAIFSRQIADYLNEGVAKQRCTALVLIATSPMLGALRPCLSGAAEKLVRNSVVGDLTIYMGSELQDRVNKALQ
ncbi:MAG: host attachment protein [Burkholderiaceae bacterium]|nr:host attachment protein [Burkholderiaceae bacterium]